MGGVAQVTWTFVLGLPKDISPKILLHVKPCLYLLMLVIPGKVDLVKLPATLLDQHGSLLYHLQEQAGYFNHVLWGE